MTSTVIEGGISSLDADSFLAAPNDTLLPSGVIVCSWFPVIAASTEGLYWKSHFNTRTSSELQDPMHRKKKREQK